MEHFASGFVFDPDISTVIIIKNEHRQIPTVTLNEVNVTRLHIDRCCWRSIFTAELTEFGTVGYYKNGDQNPSKFD